MNDTKLGTQFIYKYRRLLIASLIIGGVLGAVVSLIIPKRYMSTAIVYPYSSHAREDLVSNPQFGFEVESEQLMQLLSSRSMRDITVEKFKLYEYYELDTNNQTWEGELTQKYVEDVQFTRSKYLSVVINVTMTDPELAAKIANFQVEEINRYRESIFEENRLNDFEHAKVEFEEVGLKLNSLRDSIYALKGGSGQLLFNFIENLNNENYDPSGFVDNPQLESLVIDYRFAHEHYLQVRAHYETLKRQIDEPLPSVYTVDKALPEYKKVSPSIVINAAIGATVFLLLVITIRLVLDKWKQMKEAVSQ